MASAKTRERILDAAERLFAERGFHAVSLRQIAAEAGIGVSHLQYHFDSKEALYYSVFERRNLSINHVRLKTLDQIVHKAPGAEPATIEDIVKAFVEPVVMDSRNRKSGGDYYAQLVGQIFNEPAEHARRISRDFSDPIARLTIRALLDVLPGLRNDSLPFAYLFAVAAMISSIANTGRVEGLSGGECDSKDVDRIMSLLIPFISGGLRAVEAAEIGHREATNPKDAEET